MSDWRNIVLHDMTPEERVEIDREGRELALRMRTIREARKALSLTQGQVADALRITQGALSQMERREDMMVSTLRSYIEAMGGELKLVATFPGLSPVELSTGVKDDVQPAG